MLDPTLGKFNLLNHVWRTTPSLGSRIWGYICRCLWEAEDYRFKYELRLAYSETQGEEEEKEEKP